MTTAAASYQGYNPSYIHNRNPKQYGGNHELFIRESNRIIGEVANRIKDARTQGIDLQQFFWEIITTLSAERAQIAKLQKSNDVDQFGRRRDSCNPFYNYIIVLESVYQEYGDRLMDIFTSKLQTMQKEDGSFQAEPLEIIDPYDEHTSILKISVLGKEDLENRGYNTYADTLPPTIFGEKPKEEKTNPDGVSNQLDKWVHFANEYPEHYHARRICSAMSSLSQQYPSTKTSESVTNYKSLWVHASLSTVIEGKEIRLTDYITWMYESPNWKKFRTPEENPTVLMRTNSKIMLLHQEQILIESTLKEIAIVFEKIVTWNEKEQTLKELKDLTARFTYLATHNMRDQRGTAAENEMFIRAMMHSLDITYKVDETRMVDLEAFANPLYSDFKRNYDEMVTLYRSRFKVWQPRT